MDMIATERPVSEARTLSKIALELDSTVLEYKESEVSGVDWLAVVDSPSDSSPLCADCGAPFGGNSRCPDCGVKRVRAKQKAATSKNQKRSVRLSSEKQARPPSQRTTIFCWKSSSSSGCLDSWCSSCFCSFWFSRRCNEYDMSFYRCIPIRARDNLARTGRRPRQCRTRRVRVCRVDRRRGSHTRRVTTAGRRPTPLSARCFR